MRDVSVDGNETAEVIVLASVQIMKARNHSN